MIDSVVRSVHDQASRSGYARRAFGLRTDAQLMRKLRRILRRIARRKDSEIASVVLCTPLITHVLHA
jgi:hypothetical protein